MGSEHSIVRDRHPYLPIETQYNYNVQLNKYSNGSAYAIQSVKLPRFRSGIDYYCNCFYLVVKKHISVVNSRQVFNTHLGV